MRPAGRRKGTPNKRTTEIIERARIEVEQAQGRKIKLGKEMLEDYMMAFHNQAVMYQPLPPGAPVPPGRTPDPAKFMEWGQLVVTTAKALAEYQSPKFRAIMVSAAPTEQRMSMRPVENVIQIDDPVAMARVYQQTVKRIA